MIGLALIWMHAIQDVLLLLCIPITISELMFGTDFRVYMGDDGQSVG